MGTRSKIETNGRVFAVLTVLPIFVVLVGSDTLRRSNFHVHFVLSLRIQTCFPSLCRGEFHNIKHSSVPRIVPSSHALNILQLTFVKMFFCFQLWLFMLVWGRLKVGNCFFLYARVSHALGNILELESSALQWYCICHHL